MSRNTIKKKVTPPKDIEMHYIKTNDYRSYHVDGIFGGITPTGKVYIETYIQRSPTPTFVKQKLNPDGTYGDEIVRESKSGIIRQVESGLVMDIDMAIVLRDWLDANIQTMLDRSEVKGEEKSGK